jgi:hypothetical protein
MSHFGKKSITFFILVLLGIQTLVYGEEKALPLPLSEEEILKQKSDFDDKFNQLASKKQCQQIIAFTEAEVKEKPSITVHAYKTLYELDLQCLNKSQKSKYEVLAASQDNKESADVAYNLALNSVDKNCRKSNSLFWLEKAAKNGVEYKITLANLYHPSSSYFHTASGDIEIWAEFDKCVVKNDSKARLLYADYFSFKNPTAKCDIKYSSENISKEDEYLESERATAFAHDAYQFALLLKGEQKSVT